MIVEKFTIPVIVIPTPDVPGIDILVAVLPPDGVKCGWRVHPEEWDR